MLSFHLPPGLWIYHHGRRKEGAEGGQGSPLEFEIISKKRLFFQFRGVKPNFTTFGTPPEKLFGKKPTGPRWKKFFQRPCLSHLPTFWNKLLNHIAGRNIRLIFASLASLRSILTVFNKQGITSVSPIVWVFLLGNFKCEFIWCLRSWWKLPAS